MINPFPCSYQTLPRVIMVIFGGCRGITYLGPKKECWIWGDGVSMANLLRSSTLRPWPTWQDALEGTPLRSDPESKTPPQSETHQKVKHVWGSSWTSWIYFWSTVSAGHFGDKTFSRTIQDPQNRPSLFDFKQVFCNCYGLPLHLPSGKLT